MGERDVQAYPAQRERSGISWSRVRGKILNHEVEEILMQYPLSSSTIKPYWFTTETRRSRRRHRGNINLLWLTLHKSKKIFTLRDSIVVGVCNEN